MKEFFTINVFYTLDEFFSKQDVLNKSYIFSEQSEKGIMTNDPQSLYLLILYLFHIVNLAHNLE
jgi:hypothetical protein